MTESSRDLRESLLLSATLGRYGWERESGEPGRFETWVHPDNVDQIVLLPLNPEKGDFPHLLERAQRAFASLASVDAMRHFETLLQATRASLDATRFIKESAAPAGLIDWAQGEELFEAARTSLAAAAKARRERRRYFGNSGSYIAKTFIESSLMGQTEIGSFVVTAYTPADRSFHQRKADVDKPGRLDDLTLVTGRSILETLEQALVATKQALTEYRTSPRLELFGDAVSEGVSYELTRALAALARDSEESGVTIEFVPPPNADEVTPRRAEVAFSASDAAVLDKAATYLAADDESRFVSVLGKVTLLSRPEPGEAGIIRLDLEPGSPANKVRVRLSSEEYDNALEAHRRDLPLRLSGTLEREGHNYWIYDPADISIGTPKPKALPGEDPML